MTPAERATSPAPPRRPPHRRRTRAIAPQESDGKHERGDKEGEERQSSRVARAGGRRARRRPRRSRRRPRIGRRCKDTGVHTAARREHVPIFEQIIIESGIPNTTTTTHHHNHTHNPKQQQQNNGVTTTQNHTHTQPHPNTHTTHHQTNKKTKQKKAEGLRDRESNPRRRTRSADHTTRPSSHRLLHLTPNASEQMVRNAQSI